MIIEVTQRDIDRGAVADCKRCPIARAVARKTHRKVSVSPSFVHIVRNQGDQVIFRTYSLPKEARDFIDAFDWGLKVKYPVRPFTFELKLRKKEVVS